MLLYDLEKLDHIYPISI